MTKDSLDAHERPGLVRLALAGLAVGAAAGCTVAVFRIAGEHCYLWLRIWARDNSPSVWLPIFGIAFVAAIITGRLILSQGISFGGAAWIRDAVDNGHPGVWRRILVPKFLGSFLVKACGLSVGMEGPSVQLGCSAALGLKHFGARQWQERRLFALGGCASGLAAAFSAPLCGVPYVIEMMHEKADKRLLLFLLAGSLGVHISCNEIFGLGIIMPIKAVPPDLAGWLLFLPLILAASLLGLAYTWLLRLSARMYAAQKWLPLCWRPMMPFLAAALFLFTFPAITGEGPEIFTQLCASAAGFLVLYIAAKLLFTAFCYGSAIPCGVMVPLLTLGCVCGACYAEILQWPGWFEPGHMGICMLLGMGACFGAAERAPITAFFLVTGMTGAWEASMGILPAAAAGAWLARMAGSDPI